MIRENSNSNVRHLPSKDDVFNYLKDTVASGDLVITMGAGDIWKVADQLAKDLRSRFGED
ncbi:UDP-N-acetylmuramate--L-alanine ligase [compost metagenome]